MNRLKPNGSGQVNPQEFLVSLLKFAGNNTVKKGKEGRGKTSPHGSKQKSDRVKHLFTKLRNSSKVLTEDLSQAKGGDVIRRFALQKKSLNFGLSNINELAKIKVQISKEEKARTSAIEKLTRAASSFSGEPGVLDGFKGSDMTKHEFGEKLKKSLGVRMNKDELLAICEVFDLDGDGMISCAEFLSLFFRMKRGVEMERERARKELKDALDQKKKMLIAKAKERHEEECAKCVSKWTEDDLKRAVETIAQVAAGWDRSKAGFAGLKGFQCGGLDPMELREQLWRTFDITFSKAELGALMDTFDLDGDGTVDGPEFLSLFFRLQKKEQAFLKEQQAALKVRQKAIEQAKKLEDARREEMQMDKYVDSKHFDQRDLEAGERAHAFFYLVEMFEKSSNQKFNNNKFTTHVHSHGKAEARWEGNQQAGWRGPKPVDCIFRRASNGAARFAQQSGEVF